MRQYSSVEIPVYLEDDERYILGLSLDTNLNKIYNLIYPYRYLRIPTYVGILMYLVNIVKILKQNFSTI